jgi:hypothetical protein
MSNIDESPKLYRPALNLVLGSMLAVNLLIAVTDSGFLVRSKAEPSFLFEGDIILPISKYRPEFGEVARFDNVVCTYWTGLRWRQIPLMRQEQQSCPMLIINDQSSF